MPFRSKKKVRVYVSTVHGVHSIAHIPNENQPNDSYDDKGMHNKWECGKSISTFLSSSDSDFFAVSIFQFEETFRSEKLFNEPNFLLTILKFLFLLLLLLYLLFVVFFSSVGQLSEFPILLQCEKEKLMRGEKLGGKKVSGWTESMEWYAVEDRYKKWNRIRRFSQE